VPAYAVAILAISGALPFNFFTEHAVRFGAMFEAVIISLALAVRLSLLRNPSVSRTTR